MKFFLKLIFFNLNILTTYLLLAAVLSNTAYSKQCRHFFKSSFTLKSKITKAEKKHFKYYENIFSDSLGTTVVMGTMWMTASQLVRTSVNKTGAEGFFSPAFLVTLPLDILLTLTSHYISLGHMPKVEKFLSGLKAKDDKLSYLSRVTANAVFGASIVVSAWYLAGLTAPHAAIDINLKHSLGALALTSSVYSVLVSAKNYLFKTIPIQKDKKFSDQIKNEIDESIIYNLEVAASKRAESLGIDSVTAKHLSIRVINSVVLSKSYEELIKNSLYKKVKIKQIIDPLILLKNSYVSPGNKIITQKKSEKIKNARRALINELLVVYTNTQANKKLKKEIQQILYLGQPFSLKSSINFQIQLSKHEKRQKLRLLTSSLMDQFLSVGIAGGVFLYSTTHWAQTGQLPWFIFW